MAGYAFWIEVPPPMSSAKHEGGPLPRPDSWSVASDGSTIEMSFDDAEQATMWLLWLSQGPQN
jgi:hypothetical protein